MNDNKFSDYQKEHFDKKIISEIYEYENNDFWNWTRNNFVKFMLRYIKKGSYVLDIGCGDGYYAYQISKNKKIKKVIALDISKNSIEYAKRKYPHPNIDFIVGEFEKINFNEKKFDAIYMCEIIEHFNNPDKVLKKISMILKPEGLLFISTPNFLRLENRIRKIFRKKPIFVDKSHFKEFTFVDIEAMLKKYGFKIVKKRGVNLWAEWIFYPLFYFKKIPVINKFLKSNFIAGNNKFNFYLGIFLRPISQKIQLALKKY